MGIDIHMHIVNKDGDLIQKNIFDGRNSEWFDDLCGCGYNTSYDQLPSHWGLPENCCEEIRTDKEKQEYFGFYHIKVEEFVNWYNTYNPDVDAGWVTTREKWLYENKGVIPELKYRLYADDILEDNHFVVIKNPYDCSKWLVDYLFHNQISNSDYIVYYFDC